MVGSIKTLIPYPSDISRSNFLDKNVEYKPREQGFEINIAALEAAAKSSASINCYCTYATSFGDSAREYWFWVKIPGKEALQYSTMNADDKKQYKWELLGTDERDVAKLALTRIKNTAVSQ